MMYNLKQNILHFKFFFMERDKANESTGHLMVSDHCHPQPRVTPEELQDKDKYHLEIFLLSLSSISKLDYSTHNVSKNGQKGVNVVF